jgi:hypothetical protein
VICYSAASTERFSTFETSNEVSECIESHKCHDVV